MFNQLSEKDIQQICKIMLGKVAQVARSVQNTQTLQIAKTDEEYFANHGAGYFL